MARWEKPMFTRVPEGWAFNATPLMFGAPRIYLLDDAQKAAVETSLRGWPWAAFGLSLTIPMVVLVAYVGILHALGMPSPVAALQAGSLVAWGLVVLGLVATVGLVIAALTFATRMILSPVLAGARRIEPPPASPGACSRRSCPSRRASGSWSRLW